MVKEYKPTIALLGCGYTLTQLLKTFPPSKVVFTTRTPESLDSASKFVSRAYKGSVLDVHSKSSLLEFFENFPTIETIVEGIPPRGATEDADMLEGVHNLCGMLKQTQIKRFVYLSTTGVYGVNDGSEVDENTAPNPSNAKGKARLDAEMAYQQAVGDFVALRIAAIYGPGRGLGTSLKNGTYKLVGDGSRWGNRIHVEDLVTVIHRAIKSPNILPKALCVADDCPAQMKELVDFYCETFKLTRPPTITAEEAELAEMHTQASSQRIKNEMMKRELKLALKYPSYKEGAATEFV